MDNTLDMMLGNFYCRHVNNGVSVAASASDIIDRLSKDELMRSEAEKMLDDLENLNNSTNGSLEQRCFVSSIKRKALKYALKGELK